MAKIPIADLQGYQILSAALSPDGKKIAYGKSVMKPTNDGFGVYPPDKIYVRDATKTVDGTLLVEMGDEIHHWTWSPDGAKLAFSSWDMTNGKRNWVVDVKTNKSHEVKMPRYKIDDKEYTMGIQCWSPNGRAFLALGNGLYLVKTDGSEPRRLVDDKNIFGGSCRFSPDGGKVLFVKLNDNKSMSLYVADAADVADGKVRPIAEALNYGDMHACWSPDGRRIAYTLTLLDAKGQREGETSLFVTDADSRNAVTVLTEKHQPNQIRLRLMDWR